MKEYNISSQRFWYLLYTKSRQEKLAQENLCRQGYEIYLPLMRGRRRRQSKYAHVIEPMFPRYLFIHLNNSTDNWGPIRSTMGVSEIVRFGARPAFVPDDLIISIQAKDDDLGIQNVPRLEFSQGTKVRIIEGPMYGYEGLFVGKNGQERAMVLLDIIGKSTRVELSESQLEAVG